MQTEDECVHSTFIPAEANNWELGDSPKAREDTPSHALELPSSFLFADDGCPCACHNGQKGIRHMYACHIPLLVYGEGPIRW